MPHAFWVSLASTQWWVYFLFVFLIRVSLVATKPRTMAVKTLFFFPSLFATLSIITLSVIMQIDSFNIITWTSGLIIGISFGWLQFYLMNVQAIKNENKLYIPGSWSLFCIVVLLFSLKYYYSAVLTLDPMQVAASPYGPYFLLFYGFCTGLFMGRMAYSVYCIKTGPYTTLITNSP